MSPGTHGYIPSISTVVVVVLTPTGTAFPPPLVSFVAVQAGGFSGATENARVHVAAGAVPSVTLPAESDPTMAAPVPQSGPRVGVAASEVDDQHNAAATAMNAATLLVLDRYRCTFAAPAFL